MKNVEKTIDTSVGKLKLIANDEGLVAILWGNGGSKRIPVEPGRENRDHPVLLEAERQLQEYFGGERKTFTLNLDPDGTEFQKSVWKALSAIPYGETRSYGELAKQIGKPNASRAVGAANGKNPIAIVVPCHRVIGASGDLTGFAGGLEVKKQLLALEKESCA